MREEPRRRERGSTAATHVVYVVVFVAVLAAYHWLPKEYTEALVAAFSVLLFLATASLVAATWFYARRTAESLGVMEKQTRAVEMQVEAADRQRLAAIRPVIVFRNDLGDPEAVARYRDGLAGWEKGEREWSKLTKTKGAAIPPGPRPQPLGACLSNEGNGLALRIEARAMTDRGEYLRAIAASLGAGGSHFVEAWYEELRVGPVREFAATYRDAEGTLYWTAARDMTSSQDPWRLGEGSLPPQYEILGVGEPRAPDSGV